MIRLTRERVDHDRLFKELIATFFEEFLILFFPKIHEELDFQDMRFLQQEIFTDVTEGDTHRVDLLVETKWKGNDSLVIVHTESQADYQKDFNKRMFLYFSRIFQEYQRPVIPISIFSYDTPKNEPTSFTMTFPFGKILEFQYFIIELKKLDWRVYMRQDNPIAAALLSKMGYTKEEKVKVKIEFFRILMRLELDKARERLLTGFFETYLEFNDQEEELFLEEVKNMDKKESDKVMEIMTSYERKGIEIGIEKGMEKKTKEIIIASDKKGLDLELIAELTGYTVDQVKNVLNKN